eukprot:1699958-Amphidinium_carterae.1
MESVNLHKPIGIGPRFAWALRMEVTSRLNWLRVQPACVQQCCPQPQVSIFMASDTIFVTFITDRLSFEGLYECLDLCTSEVPTKLSSSLAAARRTSFSDVVRNDPQSSSSKHTNPLVFLHLRRESWALVSSKATR